MTQSRNTFLPRPTRNTLRTFIHALTVAALLAGLIPPPALTSLANSLLPESLQPLAEIVRTLLPEPTTAFAQSSYTYADDFDNGSGGTTNLAGNDGTFNWSGPWTAAGGTTSMSTYVNGCGSGYCIRINGSGLSIAREFDLSSTVSADLTFRYRFGGALTVQFSTDGVTYATAITANASPSLQTVAIPNSYIGQSAVWVRFLNGTGNDDYLDDVTISFVLPAGQLTGFAFNDGGNGIKDHGEGGFAGILVTATDENGVVYMDTTAADGSYVVTGITGDRVRVEFTLPTDGSLDFLEPTVAGDTTVQFHSGLQSGGVYANAGFFVPDEYCYDDARLATACYKVGDPLPNGSWASTQHMLFILDRPSTLISTSVGDNTTVNAPGQGAEVGSVWGLAYDRHTDTLYAAAVLKRFVGMGPGGPGAIYRITNASTASPSNPAEIYDLTDHAVSVGTIPTNATRGLGTTVGTQDNDYAVYPLIGKAGLGDLDMAPDGSALYVTNLADRKIYEIDTNNFAAAPTALPDFPDPACTNGIARPWGLKAYRGEVYIGVVCDGASSGSVSNLHAYVYAYKAGTGWRAVFDYSLDHPRGDSYLNSQQTGVVEERWNPWRDTDIRDLAWNCPAPCSTPPAIHIDSVQYAQPVLADIEFDMDGSLILGYLDRSGFMYGEFNRSSPDTAVLTSHFNSGDIVRACNIEGTFVLEGDSHNGIQCAINYANGEGPFGGEYFHDTRGNSPEHEEIGEGGVAVLGSRGEVAFTAMDPYAADSGGIRIDSNTSGAPVANATLYVGRSNVSLFGKSSGMGDLEVLCAPAPIEIGNRVWWDPDRNGIQDTSPTSPTVNDDQPIGGVSVNLYLDPDGNTQGNNPSNGDEVLLATTTTASGGQYFFSYEGDPTKDNVNGLANQDWSGATSAGEPTAVQPNTTYQIRIEGYATTGQAYDQIVAGVSGLNNGDAVELSVADNGGGDAGSDLRDSDAYNNPGNAAIAVQTGSAGANNHTFDFAFAPAAPATLQIVKQVSGGTVSAAFNVTVSGPNGYSNSVTVTPGTPTVINDLEPGRYTVVEESPIATAAPAGLIWFAPGYAPAGGTIAIGSGETGTITITNYLGAAPTAPTGILTVTKTVNWNGNPPNAGQPFAFTITGPAGFTPINGTISAGGVMTYAVPLGVYTVTETSPGAGWTTVYTATPGSGGSSNGVVTLQNTFTTTPFMANDANVALGKAATQSADYAASTPARLAVDGNTDGALNNGSVSATSNTTNAWWQVDLGAVYDISNIVLWSRTDGWQAQINNSRIFVSDVPFTSQDYNVTLAQPGVTNYHLGTAVAGSNPIAVNRSGRYVRVQLEGTNFLSLAEVQVFAPVISGMVFHDYNSDGQITTGAVNDSGVSGVTVTAYDATDNALGSATTNATGHYDIQVAVGGPYRVVFTNLPEGYEPSRVYTGTQNGTTVQFINSAAQASGVNLGILLPEDYCQNNPLLCTPVFGNGTNLGAGGGLLSYRYNNVGFSPTPNTLVNGTAIGAVWGIAYQRTSGTVYSAAFLKRHVGLGEGLASNPLGAIYATNVSNGSTTLLLDLSTQGIAVGTVPSNAGRGLTT
ncbi:MAG: SdrD B-like domain-containing protein, partial [Caldilineaceae bacterium]